MGLLLRMLNNDESEITKYLKNHNFRYEGFAADREEEGFQRCFAITRSTDVYIFCNLQKCKLRIAEEDDLGVVDKMTAYIPEEMIDEDNLDKFLEWLDEECEAYLS